MKEDKYFYKNIKFNANIFKTYKGLYISAENKSFYEELVFIFKTIPNNPKKYKKYRLLDMKKAVKNNFFKDILLVYKDITLEYDEKQIEKIAILEKELDIHIIYNKEFIEEYKKKIKTLDWDSVYGEVMIEEIIFCPSWEN